MGLYMSAVICAALAPGRLLAAVTWAGCPTQASPTKATQSVMHREREQEQRGMLHQRWWWC